MENIDLAYAGKKGIECVNSPEGNKVAVAEHVLGMLLSLLHKITKSDHEVRQKRWEREANRGVELTGKTVGIIGYGNTGSSFAKLLSGFDVDILAYDKYKEGFGNSLIRAVGMEDIFKEADIISLHVPLTDETNHMVDETFIKQFHKPIYICNSSRGKVVKTIDLIRGIEGGRVLGAALDVLENEDLQTFTGPDREWLKYLTGSDKVVLTPHIAGWSVESKQRMARVLVDKIIAAMTTAKEYH
jgi:D-3-phosphoglycerate dehydrogenase